MITQTELEAIKQEVFDAVKECFITVNENQARLGEMTVFLSRGDYDRLIPPGYNPNIIDQRDDFYKEADKQLFLLRDRRYSFNDIVQKKEDPELLLVELID